MKILHWLDHYLEECICVALMSAMTIMIFIQVVMRYIFSASLSWSEELARYFFVWLIYIGTSYGCKHLQHIKIDAALGLFPKKLRPYIILLGDFLILAFATYILLTGTQLVNLQIIYGKVSSAMQIPMAAVDLAPVAGFGLVIIRQIQSIWTKAVKKTANEQEENHPKNEGR